MLTHFFFFSFAEKKINIFFFICDSNESVSVTHRVDK